MKLASMITHYIMCCIFLIRHSVYKIRFVAKEGTSRNGFVHTRNELATEVMANVKLSAFLLCAMLCIGFFFVLTHGEVLPYPGDCTKYQHCDASGCFILTCGAGTEFNPRIGVCDYPLMDRTNCGNRG